MRDLWSDHIDHGFYRITDREAAKLCQDTAKVHPGCDPHLPRMGYEKLCEYGDKCVWVARTPVGDKMEWSIRDAGGWRFEGLGISSGRRIEHERR